MDRKFYHTTAWEKCRLAFMRSRHFLCERCGKRAVIVHHKEYITDENEDNPEITLNWGNLEALCLNCHNKEHKRNGCSVNKELFFDGNGRLHKKC